MNKDKAIKRFGKNDGLDADRWEACIEMSQIVDKPVWMCFEGMINLENKGYVNLTIEGDRKMSDQLRIVGVGGKKRVGKDTLCNFLVKSHGYIKLAFAENLREMCSNAFSIPMSDFLEDDLKEKPFETEVTLMVNHLASLKDWMFDKHLHLVCASYDENEFDRRVQKWDEFLGMKFDHPRHILMIVGTELIRNHVLASYHADVVFDIIAKSPDQKFCISDARFPNERMLTKKKGGTTLLIYGEEEGEASTHASETQIGSPLEYDLSIYNSKSGIAKFEMEIDTLWKLL